MRIVSILLIFFLSGCGFNAEITKTEKGWKIKSNRPMAFEATEEVFKGDSRGEPIIKIAPEVPLTKIGT